MDMDVSAKAIVFGAAFLIVSMRDSRILKTIIISFFSVAKRSKRKTYLHDKTCPYMDLSHTIVI